MKKLFLEFLAAGLLLCWMPLAAGAEASGTELSLKASETTVTTGQTVQVSVVVQQTDQPLIGALLHLSVADGFQLRAVKQGKDIEQSEMSQNFVEDELILMYLDQDVGGSPVQEGAELFLLTLDAVSPVQGQPVVCLSTDVVGGTQSTSIQMETVVTADAVQVNGETVQVEKPSIPTVVDGQSVQTPVQQPEASEPAEESRTEDGAPDPVQQTPAEQAAPSDSAALQNGETGEKPEDTPHTDEASSENSADQEEEAQPSASSEPDAQVQAAKGGMTWVLPLGAVLAAVLLLAVVIKKRKP